MEDSADLPARLPPEERTLPRLLRRQAALYGNRRLVEIGGHAWSFAEIAERFGGTLRAFGPLRRIFSQAAHRHRNAQSRGAPQSDAYARSVRSGDRHGNDGRDPRR